MFNGAKILGPFLGGLLIPLVGAAPCLFIYAAASGIMIIAIFLMKNPVAHVNANSKGNFFKNLEEGFTYAFGYLPVKTMIILTASIGLIGFQYNILLPVFSKEVLAGGGDTLGFLTTAVGSGAFSGALFMTTRKNALGLDRIILTAIFIYTAGFLSLSLAGTLHFAIASLYLVGIGHALILSSSNSIIQTISDKNQLGRVLSFYVMTFMGATTVGSLIAGRIAEIIGPANTIQGLGYGSLIIALVYLAYIKKFRKLILIRFVRLGIVKG
jgi:MFS family permease